MTVTPPFNPDGLLPPADYELTLDNCGSRRLF